MMRSQWMKRLLRALIALLGAGLGAAAALAVMQLYTWTHPGQAINGARIVAAYVGMAMAGALIFYLLSDLLIRKCFQWAAAVESHMDSLTSTQMVFGTAGLVGGLLIAALLSQILGFLGKSMFTTAFSAILYVLLGTTGLSIGVRRSEDLAALWWKLPGLRDKKGSRKNAARPKLLDMTALSDGRLEAVLRTGFVEGEVLAAGFMVEELQRMRDGTDSLRQSRGKRALETLERLQTEKMITLRSDAADDKESAECDVKLLSLAQQMGAAVLTADGALQKVAGVLGVPVLNLNDLAGALRPVVQAGDEMSIVILKAGKEAGQGVGYMDDGTMMVVEGGKAWLGKSADVVVTSVMQTSAGRMVFAKIRET